MKELLPVLVLLFFSNTSAQVREIADNSFLIEEAYNQEAGVVQHIINFDYSANGSEDFILNLTQEWPVFSDRHQLSWSMPYEYFNRGEISSPGDIMITYRYQVSTKESPAAMAPALSIIIPDDEASSVGFRFVIPVSKRLNENFAAHFNIGTSVFPSIDITTLNGSVKKTIDEYLIGGSLIWLAGWSVNFLTEYLVSFASGFDTGGRKFYTREHTINPGIRFAVDVGSLQIVPGISVPLNLSVNTTNLFLYLSLEHFFCSE